MATRAGVRRRRRLAALLVVAAALAGAGVAYDRIGPPSDSTCAASSSGPPYTLSADQTEEAALIAAVGERLGLPDHAVTVALATSLQETKLRNLPYGDQDSVGLFQQRPSEGWGTRAQILDPVYAATVFYQHLDQVPGWQSMPVTEAAQMVQRSADPLAYAGWTAEADAFAIALTGEQPAALSCTLHGFAGPATAAAGLQAAEEAQLGSPGFGVPLPGKLGWRLAAWAVANAYAYHLTSVTYDGRRWTPSAGWGTAPGPASIVVQVSSTG